MTADLDPERVEEALALHGRPGNPEAARVLADYFLEREARELAATALDHAWGHQPDDPSLTQLRAELLGELAIQEHGLVFRYVPAGTFVMGSDAGERDERPAHPRRLDAFWITDTPISWAAFCDLMGWHPPPQGRPQSMPADVDEHAGFHLAQESKIRAQYCETETSGARDWHAHVPSDRWKQGDRVVTSAELFGEPTRNNPERPWSYDVKPMVAVSFQEAERLCETISRDQLHYALPSEAQWEKAARGGLIDARYAWGDEPPSPERCDFGHFGEFHIKAPRSLPPNGYGLYGMSGGVWEWTADEYDALAYRPGVEPPPEERPHQRVLRGGSWSDCADVVRVSFRMSREADSWREATWRSEITPNIGFRIIRWAR